MFVIGGRVALALPEPWADAFCEVDSLTSEPIRALVAHRVQRYVEAPDIAAQLETREALCRVLVEEGRPLWDLVSAKGLVPPTETGCYFVPTELLLSIIGAWLDTFGGATESVAPEPESPSPAEARHEQLLEEPFVPVKPRRTRAKSG